jgi:cell division protein ZapA (FtsZ GTPase activity inhibitor)
MNEIVTFKIMGEQFTIQCSLEQKANLLKSATMLEEAILEINDQSTDLGAKRIAIMAALQIITEAKIKGGVIKIIH